MSLDENEIKFDTRPSGGKHFKKNDKLLPKARLACNYYLRGMSVKQAMLKAGYAESYCADSTHQMNFLKNRLVQTYLRERQEEFADFEETDKAKIAQYLKHIIKDDDAKDRSKAVELYMRLTSPISENITKEDVKGIVINIEQAKPD